jgi:tRNA A37 threonylcarbamoyladenosine synthetase subunit TsaC/SUA5/YrdC/protein-tyrosine-phosphatase
MAAPILGPDQVKEAARILREGGLVGFPTDTVYGIAAPADVSFHSAKLQAFKGGRSEPFSLHLPDVAAALKAAGPLHELETHAVSTLGPRGVTVIVAHGADNKGLGLRIVQHEVGSRLLALAGCTVVATSANLHGQPTLNDPAQIARLPGVDGVLSSGELPSRPASAVVRLLRCGLEILRPGAMEFADLVMLFVRRLEFVCLGNLNRSAFARELMMAMLRYYDGVLPNFLQGWAPTSSGLIGNPRVKSPEFMQKAAGEYGVSLASHVPARFVPGTPGVQVAMGDDIRHALPQARQWHVADPMGGPEHGYRAMAAQVRAQMESLLGRTARVREADAGLEARFDVLFSGS